MADSLKNDLLDVNIIPGEMPTGHKLNQTFVQMKAAIDKVGMAIGDIYSQQGYSYSLSPLALVGPNIGRVLGSAAHLNPNRVEGIRSTDVEVTFTGTAEAIPYPRQIRTELHLPWPPVYYSGGSLMLSYEDPAYWSIAGPDAAAFANRVENLHQVDSAGDYHVSLDGTITSYSGISDTGSITVTYTFDVLPTHGRSSTWSLIPDFIEIVNLCNVSHVAGSTYEIVLPVVTKASYSVTSPSGLLEGNTRRRAAIIRDYSSATVCGMTNYQATLPVALIAALSAAADKTIPQGYIQLYDESADAVISGGTWTYVDETTVQVTGLELEVGTTRYRIVVPGVDMAETLTRVATNLTNHAHSPYQPWGERVLHADLLGLLDEGTDTLEGFAPSTLGPARNPHPQYLHRYGYKYSPSATEDDLRNKHNALLGSLVVSANTQALGVATSSFSIYFGQYGAGTGGRIRYRSDAGPPVYDHLEISGKDVLIQEKLQVNKELQVNNRLAFGDPVVGFSRAFWWISESIPFAVAWPLTGLHTEVIYPTDPSDGNPIDIDRIVGVLGMATSGAGFCPLTGGALPLPPDTRDLWIDEIFMDGSDMKVRIVHGELFEGESIILMLFIQ